MNRSSAFSQNGRNNNNIRVPGFILSGARRQARLFQTTVRGYKALVIDWSRATSRCEGRPPASAGIGREVPYRVASGPETMGKPSCHCEQNARSRDPPNADDHVAVAPAAWRRGHDLDRALSAS
jgi:hypothetical protein